MILSLAIGRYQNQRLTDWGHRSTVRWITVDRLQVSQAILQTLTRILQMSRMTQDNIKVTQESEKIQVCLIKTSSWSGRLSKPQRGAGGVLTKSPGVRRARPHQVRVHLSLEALQDIWVLLHQILLAHPCVLIWRLVLPPHKVALIYPILGDSGLFI